MQKTIPIIVMAMLCLIFKVNAQTITKLSGKVIMASDNKPLPAATVKVKSSGATTQTNNRGEFTINTARTPDVLIISYIGYKTIEISFNTSDQGPFVISLNDDNSNLKGVEIVSTGYQNIPKERATGSFVLIDSALLNRRVGTNILDRLDGVTSGLIFNKNLGNGNNSDITIRGRSTLFANPSPLIVLDNFPYEGDVNNINPNDIDNISILKDAAAASIWGIRAGNGVIVITTKKGKAGNKVNISLNASTTISNRPNLYYQPQMGTSDYIDLEQYLFTKGFYDNAINTEYSSISPAVAIMSQKRKGQISAADSALQINQLKTFDSRVDLERYIYRPAVNQQYAFNLNGGSKTQVYYISFGYNKDLQNRVANSFDRITINANNTYYLLNDKLSISAGILLSTSTTKSNTATYTIPYTPYEQLIDVNGNHLAVVKEGGLSKQYTDTAGNGKLLNWNYRPLDENYSNNSTKLIDYRLNANIKYTIFSGLDFSLNYQYQKGISDYNLLYSSDSFYTRNLINSFTELNQVTSAAIRPIPLGGINNRNNNNYYSNYGRAQINYTTKFEDKNDLNILAGIEIKDYQSASFSNIYYGFNPSDNSSIPVDYLTNFPQYYSSGTSRIGYGAGQNFSIDRSRSAFFNASYAYDNRYVLSASARRDESNIFGVKANQKGVPLWSAGLMWNLSREGFYHFDQLPVLRLRTTYGYNGNLDRTTSAYLTARNSSTNSWNAPYSDIVNPPNPSLRWERIRNINFGLDYATKNNLFSGSVDYFIKKGIDLIGNSPIAPQTGVSQFKGNSADTKTSGVDLVINKNSTGNSLLKWQGNFLLSYNKEIITSYKVKQGRNLDIVNGNYVNPLEGYPYYAIFSYPFKGLDNKGRPQGLLNEEVSENYSGITLSDDVSNLIFHGSATPTIYGSLRNNLSYKDFDLSINITYKLSYWFRRNNVFSGGNYTYTSAEYERRWQNPGDELKTNIPALIYPANNAQKAFFQNSSLLVEKADHIRLQDIRLAYNFKSVASQPIFKNIQLYAYVNNLGIIWKATGQDIDPDYATAFFVNPKSFSIGLSTNF